MHISICGTHYIAVWFLLEIGWLPEALAHAVLMVLALGCSAVASPQICTCTSVRVFPAHQSTTRDLVKHGERGESCRPRARTAVRACHVCHARLGIVGAVRMVVRGVGSFWSLGRVHRSIAAHSASIYASVVSEVKSLRHRTTATSICYPHNHPWAGSRSHTALPSAHGTHTSARPCMRPAPALARCLERCGACVHRLTLGIMGRETRAALLHPPLRTSGALCWPPAEKVVDLLPALPLRAEALGRREDFERLKRRELRGPEAAAPSLARANPCPSRRRAATDASSAPVRVAVSPFT
jgi:hypothetical protein